VSDSRENKLSVEDRRIRKSVSQNNHRYIYYLLILRPQITQISIIVRYVCVSSKTIISIGTINHYFGVIYVKLATST
jgi:hypothetical protein